LRHWPQWQAMTLRKFRASYFTAPHRHDPLFIS
jgi:hypothetical protein